MIGLGKFEPGAMGQSAKHDEARGPRKVAEVFAEVACCLVVCLCFAANAAPDVNESHYLTRSRHFFQPEWCAGDLFLESADAQWIFFAATGWIAGMVSLETLAWMGRSISWLMCSASFVFVCRGLGIRGLLPAAMLVLFLELNRSGNLAGEWVVGGFEAKTLAWPLVLTATGMMLRQRWGMVWVCCSGAAALHVVVGWWGIVGFALTRAAMCFGSWGRSSSGENLQRAVGPMEQVKTFLFGDSPVRRGNGKLFLLLISVAAGFVGGAWPMLVANSGTTPDEIDAAARIQVFLRLPHHLLWSGFTATRVVSFVTLLLLWSLIRRYRVRGTQRRMQAYALPLEQLRVFTATALVAGFGGLVLSAGAESGPFSSPSVQLLRLYWFRLQDVAVPLAIALECGTLLAIWWNTNSRRHRMVARMVVCLLVLACGAEGVGRIRDRVPRACEAGIAAGEFDGARILAITRNWQQACEWCRQNTPPDAMFLTPLHQQTFHWYAERAEFAAWKHAPQDAAGLLEWQRRVALLQMTGRQESGAGVLALPREYLDWIVSGYEVDFLLVWQREVDREGLPAGWVQVYPEPGKKAGFCVLKPGR